MGKILLTRYVGRLACRDRSSRQMPCILLLICISLAPAAVLAQSLEDHYSIALGRGELTRRYSDATSATVRFSDRYFGYTGGLVIGSFRRPGFELWRDKRSLNIWCAQDESILEHPDQRQFNFGWSENFGGKGQPLRYCGGAILDKSDESIVIASANADDGYLVLKTVRWEKDAKQLLIGILVYNYDRRVKSFDYWLGQDPWLGVYGSAAGDVGWIKNELITTERSVPGENFEAGGFIDRGFKPPLGNVIAPSPKTKRPTAVFFANRFAHSADQVSEKEPLSSSTMRTMNLGWKNIRLAPGTKFEIVYSAGILDVAALPPDPRIAADWDAGIADLKKAQQEIPCARSLSGQDAEDLKEGTPRFFREYLQISRAGKELSVKGVYYMLNRAGRQRVLKLFYPFPSGEGVEAPSDVRLNGKPIKSGPKGFEMDLELSDSQETRFEVRYRQSFPAAVPRYLVSTTRQWRKPLDYAQALLIESVIEKPSETSLPFTLLQESTTSRYREFGAVSFYPDIDLEFRPVGK